MVVYKLVCSDGCYYYGTTTMSLQQRLTHHKHFAKTKTSKLYTHIRTIGAGNVTIEHVKDGGKQEENELIASSLSDPKCLNTILSRMTNQQQEDYKEKDRARAREYYRDHRDEVLAHKKEVYDAEEVRAKNKRWYEQNKSKVLEKRVCQCGGSYCQARKWEHVRTKRHVAWDSQHTHPPSPDHSTHSEH